MKSTYVDCTTILIDLKNSEIIAELYAIDAI